MKSDANRKYSLIFSGLLIGFKYLGLMIEGKIPYTEITISPETNVSTILILLSIFFFSHFIYYWFAETKKERNFFEFTITVVIFLIAIVPELYKYLYNYGIDWKVILSSLGIVALGFLLAVTFDFIFAIFFSIRSNQEMMKLGLGRIPSASKAFVLSLVFLIPINFGIIFLLKKYSTSFPHLIQNYWHLLYILPSFSLNFSYLFNITKCLGSKSMRKNALKDLRWFRKAMDLHEMHYQFAGFEPHRIYEKPPICEYACIGNFEELKKLLEEGTNPDTQDSRGWTALMWASAERHDNIVKLLLEHGADPNKVNYLDRSALGYAANYGLFQISKALIEKGAILNPKNEFTNFPPLTAAASKGHLEVVKLLVENGADIFHKGRGEQTALDIAMEEKYGEIAKYLRIEMMERSEKTNDKTDFVKNTNWLEE